HGEAWQDFIQQSLQASLAGLVENQREAQRVLREWATTAGWWRDASEPHPPASAGTAPSGEADDLRAEVDALKARLKELEARLQRCAVTGAADRPTRPWSTRWFISATTEKASSALPWMAVKSSGEIWGGVGVIGCPPCRSRTGLIGRRLSLVLRRGMSGR